MCKLRWVHIVVRKWADHKQNVGVVGRANNKAFAPGPTHEWKHVCTIFEGTTTKREVNFYLCK
jgi:hypothetical protein